jgi:hypothetical protein
MAGAFATDVGRLTPAVLGVGVSIAAAVWQSAVWIESDLTDTTKFAIAVRLVGVNLGKQVEPWPRAFANVFDRLFGKKHPSFRCFLASCLASMLAVALAMTIAFMTDDRSWFVATHIIRVRPLHFVAVFFIANAIPDFLSLLATRSIFEERRAFYECSLPLCSFRS